MDLPPDKVKLLRGYDDDKKWDLICDQVSWPWNTCFPKELHDLSLLPGRNMKQWDQICSLLPNQILNPVIWTSHPGANVLFNRGWSLFVYSVIQVQGSDLCTHTYYSIAVTLLGFAACVVLFWVWLSKNEDLVVFGWIQFLFVSYYVQYSRKALICWLPIVQMYQQHSYWWGLVFHWVMSPQGWHVDLTTS